MFHMLDQIVVISPLPRVWLAHVARQWRCSGAKPVDLSQFNQFLHAIKERVATL